MILKCLSHKQCEIKDAGCTDQCGSRQLCSNKDQRSHGEEAGGRLRRGSSVCRAGPEVGKASFLKGTVAPRGGSQRTGQDNGDSPVPASPRKELPDGCFSTNFFGKMICHRKESRVHLSYK